MQNCPKCNKEHTKSGKYCSRSCANSRGPRSIEFKELMRQKLQGRKIGPNVNKGKHLISRIIKICPTCNLSFQTTIAENKKYCSKTCFVKNAGGNREGAGKAKTGYYKGIYCGSTYELAWVIYNLDHGNAFTRFNGFLEENGKKYYPDFLIENKIIEIKGYESVESVQKKTKIAESHGFTVNVLRREQLQKEFNWVKQNYTYKNMYELYDDYKPTYNLVCAFCGTQFTRDCISKSYIVYCSKLCSIRGNHKHRP
jgi:hypothetical protein